jgi:hypothetical protein
MALNELKAAINLPDALKSDKDGLEKIHRLPGYEPTPVFRVADFTGIPASWLPDGENQQTYFFPIREGKAMWFDLNLNNEHTHDVAAVMWVQQINPLTGQPGNDLNLEQYHNNCPADRTPLSSSGLCKTCRVKWPPQNYLAASAQGTLNWIDGWQDGVITRQWVFTADMAREVAANIIGGESIPAIRIAFYLSKEPKPQKPVRRESYRHPSSDVLGLSGSQVYGHAHRPKGDDMMEKSIVMRGSTPEPKLGVAAGEGIDQKVIKDNNPITYWEETPTTIFTVYWVTRQEFERIYATKVGGSSLGWLRANGVPVGNKQETL